MWRRTYLILAAIRLYLAICPSYIHPDENFQGPEVIAGRIFPYPSHETWEWTSEHPIRSVFPLWPLYALPMTLLKWLWADSQGHVSTGTLFYSIRIIMFIVSFVLEDWAVYELVPSPRMRRQAIVLVASSYVTWTYQAHTFSNSLETIIVLWSLVIIERILSQKQRSSLLSCTVLAFLTVLGTFTRITFPAFILIPGLRLIPYFLQRPLTLTYLLICGAFFLVLAIATDTAFFHPDSTVSFWALLSALRSNPVITPLNSLVYNTSTKNLAVHGLHPHYQHLVVNLPQLLGPALFLILTPSKLREIWSTDKRNRFISAVSGTLIISILPHQEARFLLPVIPLLLTCVPPLPHSRIAIRIFLATWIPFNLILSLLMGIYHQGGVFPTSIALPKIINALNTNGTLPSSDLTITTPLSTRHSDAFMYDVRNTTIFWWKVYTPPRYLLGDGVRGRHDANSSNENDAARIPISTVLLWSSPVAEWESLVCSTLPQSQCYNPTYPNRAKYNAQAHPIDLTLLVTPYSSLPLLAKTTVQSLSHDLEAPPQFNKEISIPNSPLTLTPLYFYRQHINLDDIDFEEDGVTGSIRRVLGMRGLIVWRVRKACP